jgi:hypothetical protein
MNASSSFGLNREVARPVRFELTTYSFGGCRSIHLSYGRIAIRKNSVQASHLKSAVRFRILALARLPRYSAFAATRPTPPGAGNIAHLARQAQPRTRMLSPSPAF